MKSPILAANPRTLTARRLTSALLRCLALPFLVGTVFAAPPVITEQPVSQVVAAGARVVLRVEATGSRPNALKFIEWRLNGVKIPNINHFSSLVIVDVQKVHEGSYQAFVTEYGPSGYSEPTPSEVAVLTVVDGAPVIIAPLAAETVYPGTEVRLAAGATGTAPRTYQWFKDSVPVSGASRPVLVLNSVNAIDAGNYSVVVTNAFGSASNAMTLAVNAPPAFAGGAGTVADPYLIATAAQLEGIRVNLDKHFALTANIDLAVVRFIPIRNQSVDFEGSLDGRGFSISNWRYVETVESSSLDDYFTVFKGTGLISQIAPSGRVQNLALVNCDVTGSFAGILTWYNKGLLVNCFTSGVVQSGQMARTFMAGGLVGQSVGSVIGCRSDAMVLGDEEGAFNYLGGLIGYNIGDVSDSTATGAVVGMGGEARVGGLTAVHEFSKRLVRCRATGPVYGSYYVGGLVGENYGLVESCSATGSVTATNLAGGLVGDGGGGLIRDSYATGAVDGGHWAGGLTVWSPIIQNSYSTGTVSAGIQAYGFGGAPFSSGAGATVTSSYWDLEASGIATSGFGTGKTTAEMKTPATFVGWDTTSIWRIDAGSYPVLRSSALGFPIIATPSETREVGASQSVTFSVSVLGAGPFTYQWRRDGVPVIGATGPSLTIPDAQPGAAGVYTVSVSNAAGSVTSGNFVLNVIVPEGFPAITQQPISREAIVGSTTAFMVMANGDGALSYQWFRDGTPIAGATEDLLLLTNAGFGDAGTYRVRVSNAVGHVDSEAATLAVNGPVLYGADPGVVYAGGPAFTLSLFGQGLIDGSTVLWNGVPMPTTQIDNSQLQAEISAAEIASAGGLRVVAIQVLLPGGEVSTALTTLVILVPEVVEYNTATGQPGEFFDLSLLPYEPGMAGLSVSVENQGIESNVITGLAATYSSNPTPAPLFDVGSQFVDLQINGADAADVATANFYYPSTITGTAETDLVLLHFNGTDWQPVLGSGGAVPAKDTTDNLDDSISGGRVTVVFDNTSTPKLTELTGTVFTFGVSSASGGSDKHKPKITTQPRDQTVAAGSDVTFSVGVAASSGPVTYQWKLAKKHGQNIPGATGATLVLRNVTKADEGDYVVTVTNSKGSTTSKKAALTALPPAPVISAAPQSQTVNFGDAVTFAVTATSEEPMTYQWLHDGKKIGDEKHATLTLTKLKSSDSGAYSVVVSNDGGSVTSAAATLTVLAPPSAKNVKKGK